MQRIITVVSTRNSKIVRINENRENLTVSVSASGLETNESELGDFLTTWGDIKNLLVDKLDFDFGNLLATEKVSKNSLVNDGAAIADGDVTIFLRPIETKAGSNYENLSFIELRRETENLGEDCKTFLNSFTDKNWTQLSREELRQGLVEYNKNLVKTEPENKEKLVLRLLEELGDRYGNDSLFSALACYEDFMEEISEDEEDMEETPALSQEDKDLLEEASKY
jgi:hypothetical protein